MKEKKTKKKNSQTNTHSLIEHKSHINK